MNLTKAQRLLFSSSLSVFLAGCGSPNYSQSDMHMTVEEAVSSQTTKPEKIPALVKASPTAPVLSNTEDSATFDVVVTSVPVRDLLFALARDAGVNMDIDDGVGGFVSLSALDQTLDAILERIAKQVSIRFEQVGNAIVVKADTPYHKYYQIDFLNINRTYASAATGGGVGDTGTSSVSNTGGNDFWAGLESSLRQILDVSYVREGESGLLAGSNATEEEAETLLEIDNSEYKTLEGAGSSFNLNPETGVLIVYAPESLQKEVQTFLDRALSVAKRQVLLEATIVEVVLNNQYAQGIDWSLFNSLATEGLALYQGAGAGGAAAVAQFITQAVSYTVAEIEFDAAQFGTVDATTNAFSSNGYTRNNYIADGVAVGLTAAEAGRIFDSAVTGASTVDSTLEANVLARALRDGYITARTNEAYRNPEHRVTDFTPALSQERDEDTQLFTYTGGATYTRSEINEQATRRASGGLVPTTGLPERSFTAAYRQGDISAAVQLLDTFGDAKVLSSPRISTLNHQPAILRVVDQEVYFTFDVTESVNDDTGAVGSRTVSSTENVVDIGFTMNVFPQISDDGEIILNLKPAVTRVVDYRRAPVLDSFGSAGALEENIVPITRVRELESVISLRDGEIAVLGGLLEDRTGDNSSSVPGLSQLPGVGKLFERKNESTFKTEFVVFIRAKIINNPSVNGDYAGYRHLLPNSDFILRDTESTLLPPSQLKTR